MISLANEVKNTVNEFVNNKKMFTAFDVTTAIRLRNSGERISHRDVRVFVHRMFDNNEMGIYDRTNGQIGSSVSPFVFHLSHEDVSEYDPDWVQSYVGNSNNSTAVQTASQQSNSQPCKKSDKTVYVTNEKRINVPHTMLKDFSTGYMTIASVLKDGKNVDAILISSVPTSNLALKKYNVSQTNRIRISEKFLKRIGSVEKYNVSKTGTSSAHLIVITPE